MTRVIELVRRGPTLSFEFFPPSTDEGRTNLDRCVDAIGDAASFVSVTYGAGGSSRERTRDLVMAIDGSSPYPAMPHLTCVGHTRDEVVAMLHEYRDAGIVNVLALAGDPPADGSPVTGDFTYASELVELVHEVGDFGVAVAAFPEGHPRSASLAEDRRLLAAKLSAADLGIANFFFRLDDYLAMRDDLAARGCDTPVLPGIMPMLNPQTIRRFAAINGASLPEDLIAAVESASSPEDAFEIAMDAAIELALATLREGAPGVHMYCLNRADVAAWTVANLDLGVSSEAG
ncbi:MAG: methylenetetrahydrofolate reductase [Microthrixaceae bacterium]